MVLDRLSKALVPGTPSLGLLIVRAREELKHTEELMQHVQQVRAAKQQEVAISAAIETKAQEGKPSVAKYKQGEASSRKHENEKSEGDLLAEKLEREQRNVMQQRGKLQNVLEAFRKGQT